MSGFGAEPTSEEPVAAETAPETTPEPSVVEHLEATLEEAVADFQDSNPVPPAPDPSGDPFPSEIYPEQKSILIGKAGASHGGFLRQNNDGTLSFKPTSYLGNVVTAKTVEEFSDLLP